MRKTHLRWRRPAWPPALFCSLGDRAAALRAVVWGPHLLSGPTSQGVSCDPGACCACCWRVLKHSAQRLDDWVSAYLPLLVAITPRASCDQAPTDVWSAVS
nr:hypothetical protein [Pseudodesulfovibrio sp.]